jgi:hypothetical protein
MSLPERFPRSISREEMADLPIRRYEGEILLVEDARALERAAEDIHRDEVVGFDTETRPSFRPGESHPPALAPLLAARGILKTGISLADDLKKLRQSIAFTETAVLDLGHVAQRHGLKQTGLRNLTGIFLGTRVPKGAKTTNWAAHRLSAQQITYAATDAWACRELYLKFRELGLL